MARNISNVTVKISVEIEFEMCFLVGRYPTSKGEQWEVQGIYDDKELAEESCMNKYWFVMPVEKNKALPLKSVVAGYYPNNSEPIRGA